VKKPLNEYGPTSTGAKEEEDSDVDLFGSDEEDEEAEKLKAERVAMYNAKKSKSNEQSKARFNRNIKARMLNYKHVKTFCSKLKHHQLCLNHRLLQQRTVDFFF